MMFPNPCCRCGFCCLSETCPIGQRVFMVEKRDPCPALVFDNDTATCLLALVDFEIGIGQGCCIKAQAYAKGVEYDFASLEPRFKIGLAKARRTG